jgi:DNA-binding NtrC family response regulator
MLTVIVVEADQHLREAYRAYFSKLGFQVRVATDALHCLSLLRETVPNPLILDRGWSWCGDDGDLAFLHEDTELPAERVVVTASDDASRSMETPASSMASER